MDGWVHGWMGTQVSEWTVEWMDEWRDGQVPLRRIQKNPIFSDYNWPVKFCKPIPVEEGTGHASPFSECMLSDSWMPVLLQDGLVANLNHISPG